VGGGALDSVLREDHVTGLGTTHQPARGNPRGAYNLLREEIRRGIIARLDGRSRKREAVEIPCYPDPGKEEGGQKGRAKLLTSKEKKNKKKLLGGFIHLSDVGKDKGGGGMKGKSNWGSFVLVLSGGKTGQRWVLPHRNLYTKKKNLRNSKCWEIRKGGLDNYPYYSEAMQE